MGFNHTIDKVLAIKYLTKIIRKDSKQIKKNHRFMSFDEWYTAQKNIANAMLFLETLKRH